MPRQAQMTWGEGWGNNVHIWSWIYAAIERNATPTIVTNVPYLFLLPFFIISLIKDNYMKHILKLN